MSLIRESKLTQIGDTPIGKVQEILEALSSMWIRAEHFQRVTSHPEVLQEVSEVLTRGCAPRSLNERLARAVLRRHFFGMGEWEMYLGEEFSWEDVKNIPEFPWDIQTLLQPCPFIQGKSVFETHVAFLGRPVWGGQPTSLIRLKSLAVSYQEDWSSNQSFATDQALQSRWYLVCLFPVKSRRLPATYEVPRAVEMLTACALSVIKGRAEVHGEWQEFETRDVAKAVRPPKGCTNHIAIRHLFTQAEVYLSQPNHGLGASRKLPG